MKSKVLNICRVVFTILGYHAYAILQAGIFDQIRDMLVQKGNLMHLIVMALGMVISVFVVYMCFLFKKTNKIMRAAIASAIFLNVQILVTLIIYLQIC